MRNAYVEDILAIAGNRRVYDRLRELIRNQSATAFIGAGASVPLYPTWSGLLNLLIALAEKYGVESSRASYWRETSSTKALQVALQVRRSIDESVYHEFLYETFRDRLGDDGRPYTDIHSLLVQIDFKAYLTTNYDPGLLQARRLLRPDIIDSSFLIWNQHDKLYRWDRNKQPILFAHGYFDDVSSIVLDQSSYKAAYSHRAYERFVENLWLNEFLVFVGFGFRDPTLEFLGSQVTYNFVKPSGTPPRHVAILGVDKVDVLSLREEFLETYHSDVLFYPVNDGSHSALRALLESLISNLVITPPLVSRLKATTIPTMFVHEPDEDRDFTGRKEELSRLNAWLQDRSVRGIGISALGGSGKTALICRLLRKELDCRDRHFDGIFFWSFYRDRDTSAFLSTLKDFHENKLSVLVVLDGLEVLQETPGNSAFGKLIDIPLAQFINENLRGVREDVVILTSRFSFPEFTQYLGSSFRSLPMLALDPEDGAALLLKLGLRGSTSELHNICSALSGHPLAIRILARSIPPEFNGDATRVWQLDSRIGGDDPLEIKILRLMKFYELRLSLGELEALKLISLFRAPVPESTLQVLWTSSISLEQSLRDLQRDGVIALDLSPSSESLYSCHPILREYFRASKLGQAGFGQREAKLIADRPDAEGVRTVSQIQIVRVAIELLLGAKDMRGADDLYRSRFRDGLVFRSIPAPKVGLELANEFVSLEVRALLSTRQLAFYLNECALLARDAGEPETGIQKSEEALALLRAEGDKRSLAGCLRTLGSLKMSFGELRAASEHLDEAIKLTTYQYHTSQIKAEVRENSCLAFAEYIAFLRGGKRAISSYSRTVIEAGIRLLDEGDLGSYAFLRPLRLIRVNALDEARQEITSNLAICEQAGWFRDVAVGTWLLAWIDGKESRWEKAYQGFETAKAVFHTAHMVQYLAQLHVSEVEVYRKQLRFEDALLSCERALSLASPRKYRLIHADVLNCRARVWLEERSMISRALDDAEAAEQVSLTCEYAWGQFEACANLTQIWRALGDSEKSEVYLERERYWHLQLRSFGKAWPDYARSLAGTMPRHDGSSPDQGVADFNWCMTAIDWGWSIEDTATELSLVSEKARERLRLGDEGYPLATAQTAAAAVARKMILNGSADPS